MRKKFLFFLKPSNLTYLLQWLKCAKIERWGEKFLGKSNKAFIFILLFLVCGWLMTMNGSFFDWTFWYFFKLLLIKIVFLFGNSTCPNKTVIQTNKYICALISSKAKAVLKLLCGFTSESFEMCIFLL